MNYNVKRKTHQIGHSIGVTLPAIWVRAAKVKAGQYVKLSLYEDGLFIQVKEENENNT